MKKIFKLFICLCMAFIMTSSVEAKSIDHFYGKIDNEVNLKDDVNGSTFLAGADISMKSKAEGISFMAGNKVVFEGESEYIALAGNSLEVKGLVTKDAFIAGSIVTLEKDSDLQRDVLIGGADVDIYGSIGRNISIYGSNVNISGATISGNVQIYATNIKVDKDTVINGNLSYPKDAEVSIAKDVVKGKIEKTKAIKTEEDGFAVMLMGEFWSFLSLLIVFAVISLVIPRVFTRMHKEYDKFDFNKGLETFTKGLLFMILLPIVIFILLLMSFGIPLAFILLALYFITIYLSTIFTGYLIGYKLWQRFFNKDINMLVVGILGILVLFILSLIPGISFIVSSISMIIGIGIIYDVLKKGSSD